MARSHLRRFAFFTALGAALVYGAGAGLYIVYSGRVALAIAQGTVELSRIELGKGLGFVLLTSLGLFAVVWVAVAQVVKVTAELEMSRAAFLAAERKATAAQFAAGIVHDFNNLLQVVEGVGDSLEDAVTEAERRGLAEELSSASARARELTRRLIDMVRGAEDDAPARLDVVALVQETLRTLTRRVHRGSAPVLRAPPRLEVWTRATLVRQILVNLLLNARDAAGPRGRVEVELRATPRGFLLAVDDDGPGVEGAAREAIFDAFHTTKPHGTGLGLLSVRACAERHGGAVRVLDSRLGGARFEVELAEAAPTHLRGEG